jgi:hypothetical protein
MVVENRGICRGFKKLAVFFAVICILAPLEIDGLLLTGLAAGHGQSKAAGRKLKIFDGKPKVIVVNGYSTSFQWPRILQRKLDRYSNGKRLLKVKQAAKGAGHGRFNSPEVNKMVDDFFDKHLKGKK